MEPGDRGQVDDGAAAALGHVQGRGAGTAHRAHDVDVERLAPQLVVALEEGDDGEHAGVVDEDVEAAARLGDAIEGGVDAGGVGDVDEGALGRAARYALADGGGGGIGAG